MEEIKADFAGKVDGMFLFAGADVVDFYPKFGFRRMKEYQYSKQVNNSGSAAIVQVPMDNAEAWESLGSTVKQVILGFTPLDTKGYDCVELQLEDTNLFVQGEVFRDFGTRRLMVQTLSHT